MPDEPTKDQPAVVADIFISRNNQTHGPYPRDIIETWVNTGKINRGDLACTNNTPWQPVAKLLWPEQFAAATSGLSSRQWGIIVAVILGFVALAAVLSTLDNAQKSQTSAAKTNSQSASEPKSLSLHATCSTGLDGVTVTNLDSFDYTNCELSIQQGFLTFYRASSPNIRPSKSVTVSFFNFTDTDGQRFNYFKEKPQRVLLSCKLNGQEGLAGWEFSR